MHIKLKSNIWQILLITLNFANELLAFPSGGPSFSCRNLEPGHSNGTQPDSPPYTIVVSSPTLEAGGSTRVSLESTGDYFFLGFICAVSDLLDQKNDPVGTMLRSSTFQEPDLLQTITCARSDPNTAITHTSRREKMKVEFDWVSPVNASEGQQFKLRCTVVQSFYKCWTNIQRDLTIVSNNGGSRRDQSGNEVIGPSTNQPDIVTGSGSSRPPQNNGRSHRSGVAGPNRGTGNNNSVSRDGLLRELENNLLASENSRQTLTNNNGNRNIINNLNNNENNLQQPRLPSPTQPAVRQRNGGNNLVSGINNPVQRLNQNDQFIQPSNPIIPVLSPTREGTSILGRTELQPSPALNQINSFSQFPNRPISNSLTEMNSNRNENSGRLSNFERAVILELMRMGVNFFPGSGDRFQQRSPRRDTNSGNVFRNTGAQNFPDARRFTPLNSAINANPFPSDNSNSRFQDSSLIRSETQVFDPSSVQRPFRREIFSNRNNNNNNNNPNSRGLFQLRNARTFSSDFNRIRIRNG